MLAASSFVAFGTRAARKGNYMTPEKVERIHITLSPIELAHIDDYRFTARLESRSEAMRQLAFVALEGKLPKEHLDVLHRMKSTIQQYSPDEPVNESPSRTERIHVTFYQAELEQIDDYRFTARFESRSDTIRHLASLALNETLSEKHLSILERMKTNRFPRVKIEFPTAPSAPRRRPLRPKGMEC